MQISIPKVSVIIPAYNQAQFLDYAIQSVFAQTFQDYEIIVVDDGSTDQTPEVAKKYSGRICYLRQENRGLAGARNTGIHEAQGNLIGLLDCDDVWAPNYLETMVSLADLHPEASVFFCAARCMDAEGNDLPQVLGYQSFDPSRLYWKLLRANFLIPSTVTFRKETITRAGYFDEVLRSCEDSDLWLRLLSEGTQFFGIPSVLIRYRIHGSSLSVNLPKMQFSHRSVVEKRFGSDDGQYDQWRKEKRIGFGGTYWYQLLTNIQRQNNWQGAEILQKAILADPETSTDSFFFYDLALGNQPLGYRGSPENIHIRENAKHIEELLAQVFRPSEASINMHARAAYATAYRAIGMVAYNIGDLSISRKYFIKALQRQPAFFRDPLVAGNLLKSFLGKSGIGFVRRILGSKRN